MTIGQMMLGEFDQEMQNTRKTLERCPDEKWNWKPHEKSGTVGWLAGHIATMPGWVAMTINTEELDYAPVDGPSYQPPKIENKRALLTELDKNVAEARAALASVSDAEMMKGWKLLAGGKEIFTMPRVACIRGMVMNHIIHHRAQLTVYYRLLGVPVPGLYGPSADEGQPGAAEAAAN
ncbi:MAG: damage-inducible protein DinB [Acidobacteria bacterium]|nr:MAG: damage-inducible protein DinB [Acidobacteria bacterium 13_1_20CM_58_21]PYU45524.1 MAG: damage-inducible protein DinB [Acidobacteriota bacterium]PYU47073.1 MAG: damage-inducible protein DinB [Acidobacteriota bacterium]PYU53878.1 MAG: damage-inducible protein DinB [Acidobacteriota bacterium]PYU72725.1 MAG: damage-inducible protein DinB [Acidobacteriota bacterium]